MKKLFIVILLLVILLNSGVVFAGNNSAGIIADLFEEASSDPAVQEASIAAVKPAIKLFSIGVFIFGIIIILFTIWHVGDGSMKIVRAKTTMSKERMGQLVLGIVVGLLFMGSGVYSFIGFADRILTQPFLKIIGS